MRSLRELLTALRITPEDRRADCCERSMEALYDCERPPAHSLGDPEQAAIEVERRRLSSGSPAMRTNTRAERSVR